jgi:magnesium-protoporphyrin O-methyltransferase
MDSLIHYEGHDIAHTLAALAPRTGGSIVFTIAPRTPALTIMHAVGQFFPRGNRSPAIAPISKAELEKHASRHAPLHGWRFARSQRIDSGFYVSQALEVRRP